MNRIAELVKWGVKSAVKKLFARIKSVPGTREKTWTRKTNARPEIVPKQKTNVTNFATIIGAFPKPVASHESTTFKVLYCFSTISLFPRLTSSLFKFKFKLIITVRKAHSKCFISDRGLEMTSRILIY